MTVIINELMLQVATGMSLKSNGDQKKVLQNVMYSMLHVTNTK